MTGIFSAAFDQMLLALFRVFFIILLAGILVRKNIIHKNQIDALSRVTVLVLLPALVFGNTLQFFDPAKLTYWWILPLLGVALSLLGLITAYVIFLPRPLQQKNLLAIAAMQNAGYLVLPIGQIIYPTQFKTFSLLTFLFILGYNPVLWTLGKYLITSTNTSTVQIDWRKIITPPAAANIISLVLVMLGWQSIFPKPLIDSIHFLGEAAVPMATFVLGATLGAIVFKEMASWVEIVKVLSVKYILIPLVVVVSLWYFKIGISYPLLADFLVIQSAAAPATGLIIQVRAYGGQQQKVASIMLITYVFCLIAMPFWIALWHSLNAGFSLL